MKKALVVIFLIAAISGAAFGSCSSPKNAIEQENCLPGTSSDVWGVSGAGDLTIQGFSTDMSYNQGDTASFKISTTASAYTIEIYRMGYYQGNGARLISTITPNPSLALNQPACITDTTTGLADCGNWKVSATWNVPTNAVSGIYFARLIRNDTQNDSLITFVVRNDSSTSAILFQTADESWQAYNSYGGHSLYGPASGADLTNRAYKVSYNRPLQQIEIETQVFYAEYPMVRWLEANGYDVSYFSGVDGARFGSFMLNHKLYMTVGHDEYVSGPRRANIEAARSAGLNLAFFTGNGTFWKTRWENSVDGSNTPYRTLVCYKESLSPQSTPPATAAVDPNDPPTWTGSWRDPAKSPPADGGRPENALTGQLFRVNGPGSDNDDLSIKVPAADGKMRFWRNTAIAVQSPGQTWTLPADTLGYEWDTEEDNGFRPAGLFDLSTATYQLTSDYLLDAGGLYGAGTATHHLSLYRSASGGLVFGAGTVQWSWGLDPTHDGSGPAKADVNMQQATVNLLADMGLQPATLQSGLVAASASTDTTPPTSTITSPAPGATVQPFTVVTIQGTASDTGGQVAGVEVSTDDGNTWHPASGRTQWSYNWNVTSGTVTILSRAVDDSGNLETPSGGTTVNVASVPFETIFTSGQVPTVADGGPDSPVELGVTFKSDVNGSIVGIRFFKASTNTGTHVGNLWTASGTLLASATFSNETASGWQQINFATPVTITAGTVYIASYHTTIGHYAADRGFFSTTGVDNPPLHALQNGVGGSDGVFSYGTGSTFPNTSGSGANYWVDVAFAPASTGILQSIVVTPANLTISGAASQQFTAIGSFSDNTTENLTNEVTWSSSNTAVATVNTTGLVTGVAGGSTTITAMSGTISGSTLLTVKPAPLAITTTSLPAAIVGATYSYAITASGGTAPYSWSLSSGALPSGLVMSPSSGTISGTPSLNGNYTFTVQLADGASPAQIASQRLSIDVLPASTPRNIWPATTVPSKVDGGPDAPVELGVRFQSDVDGTIVGIRFYKASTNTGTHVGNLWSNTGQLLATATFTNETTSGWQQVNFSTPVAIKANTLYVASYHVNSGHYSVDYNYFKAAGFDNPPLHAIPDGANSNSVYFYSTTSAFPKNSFESSNYWVDVSFVQAPTLNSITITPANTSITSGSTQQFVATGTYSDNTTQDLSNQVTWSSSSITIAPINSAGTVSGLSGGSTTITASEGNVNATTSLTVQPLPMAITTTSLPSGTAATSYSAALSVAGGSVPFTWSVISGALPAGLTLSPSGQISGVPTMAATYNFTGRVSDSGLPQQSASQNFSITILPTATPRSIWSAGEVPGTVDGGPDDPVELGVRFKSDVDGSITGIRYYKASTNTGTHIGNLWSSSGTLLATATFTNETNSGWQQVSFSKPVPITANTVYVASYHTNGGHYSVDLSYFANAGVDSGPLHALQDGIAGSNGLFTYGAVGSFPSSTFRSSNYWVDVVFSATTPIQSIAIAPLNPTIAPGGSQQFTATGTYSDGTTADVTSQVTWSSANPSVATIGASGLVVAIAGGTTAVQASQANVSGSTTVTVPVSPLAIVTSTLPSAVDALPYSTALNGVGGTAPYSWSITSGSLPPGITLASATGQLSGTPTGTGTYTFTTQLADGGTPQQVTSRSLTIVIPSTFSLWSPTTVPTLADAGSDSSVELGIAFRSDVNGQVTGIRFYKSAANIGTHVADLWTSDGTLLATATFTNETMSGWQEVDFSTPVPITANTVYVASYNTMVGHYADDLSYFATSGVDAPPLHAPQNGAGNGNGVFSYGPPGTFPTSSSKGSNYWVDIVFEN